MAQNLNLTITDANAAPLLNSYVSLNGNVGLNELGTYDFYF